MSLAAEAEHFHAFENHSCSRFAATLFRAIALRTRVRVVLTYCLTFIHSPKYARTKLLQLVILCAVKSNDAKTIV